MNSKIFVVSHKNLKLPKLKNYYPLQVGLSKDNFPGYLRDNTGDNIAFKNLNYCELTAMYWIWKNIHADVKGLVHYRRFFSDSIFNMTLNQKRAHIIKIDQINNYLNDYDLVLPKKRRYYIETMWSHYAHSHKIVGLKVTKKVIQKYFPNYLNSFNIIMNKRSAHMFNMLIARSNVFNDYAKWLFSILFKVEKKLDVSNWSRSEARVYGYISELLLDVWLYKNDDLKCKELPVSFMGSQHWIKKGSKFLYRKVFNNE